MRHNIKAESRVLRIFFISFIVRLRRQVRFVTPHQTRHIVRHLPALSRTCLGTPTMIQFAHAGAHGQSSEPVAGRAETRNLSQKHAAFHGRQSQGHAFSVTLGSGKAPEIRGHSQRAEQFVSLVHRASPPVGRKSIAIPCVGQLPSLLHAQGTASRKSPSCAPPIDVIFRPEEKHGFSIEDNVVPPVPRRKREMNDPWRLGCHLAFANLDGHAFAAASAGRKHAPVALQHGNHPQRVPDTVSVPASGVAHSFGFHHERRGNSRKRVRHEDLSAAWLKDQYVSGSQFIERIRDIGHATPKSCGNFRLRRTPA